MKTIRRLIYGEVLGAVAFVTLGFLALFFFFDLVEEIQALGLYGAAGYKLVHALAFVTLLLPSHLYELMPISVLIGTIIVMARLAQTSEFTILRTSGLGPWRALRTLMVMGVGFVVITFAIGDYLAPVADRTLEADGSMRGVRIFEFNSKGFLTSTVLAQTASFDEDNAWTLRQVTRTVFAQRSADTAMIERSKLDSLRWPSAISAEMVSAALLKPDRMSTIDLFQYIQHLQANEQTAQRYEIEFWKKVFYPLSCLVMVVLALPFAYLHFRSGGIAGYVFGGVMAGISFFMLNNVFGYIGNLQNWQPWLAAALPGLIYSVLSLTAFGWLVLRR